MNRSRIVPDKITKPIQLLAVWLTGLVVLDSAFIGASLAVSEPIWLSTLFAISAVAFVPLFLIFVFLLQTKYRVEMQEDPYFHDYKIKINELTGEEINNLTYNEESILQIQENLRTISNDLLKINLETQSQIGSLAQYFSENIDSNKLAPIHALKDSIFSVDSKIQKLKAELEWSGIKIKLNTSLNQYIEIRKKLKENAINIAGIFGRDDAYEKENIFLLSYGKNVDCKYIIKLVDLLRPFELQYIQYLGSSQSKGYDNGIYIGSFTYRGSYKVTKINDDLIQKISTTYDNNVFNEEVVSREEILSII